MRAVLSPWLIAHVHMRPAPTALLHPNAVMVAPNRNPAAVMTVVPAMAVDGISVAITGITTVVTIADANSKSDLGL